MPSTGERYRVVYGVSGFSELHLNTGTVAADVGREDTNYALFVDGLDPSVGYDFGVVVLDAASPNCSSVMTTVSLARHQLDRETILCKAVIGIKPYIYSLLHCGLLLEACMS